MDIFRADGHLTDEALAAFVQGGIVDELPGWRLRSICPSAIGASSGIRMPWRERNS